MKLSLRDTAAARVLDLPAEPPEWVDLMPVGRIDARDGRRWRLDDAAAFLRVTRAYHGTTDPVVDYEHQSQHAERNGQPAPAAGWIKDLRLSDGGDWIQGRVEWQAEAASMIASRKYRYLSPFFFHDRNGKALALANVGLTNNPALQMRALANVQPTDVEIDSMNEEQLKALRTALGLGADADAAAVLAACTAVIQERDGLKDGVASLRTAAGVAADTELAALATGIAALKTKADGGGGGTPDADQYVPRELFDQQAATLKALQDRIDAKEASGAVDDAIRAGKITPGQRAWAEAYCKSDADGFASFVDGAPVIVPPGRSAGQAATPPDTDAPLSEFDRAACKALGLTEDEFKASRKALAERRAELTGEEG